MRSRTIPWVFLGALACAGGSDGNAGTRQGRGVDSALAGISAQEMRARIQFLANDALRGRATPSAGLDTAAAYIARRFEAVGLRPGAGASYIQWYPLGSDVAAARAPNVIGVLDGSDAQLRGTYIVFSAHMDHLGVGPPDARGDSIYNGADDDASGTAAVLELARAFASLGERPARSLVFLTVSGEELGLYGSQAFVDSGVVPVDRIVANINIDMIGRNAPDTVAVIGRNYSTLGELVEQIAREQPALGLTVVDDPWPEEGFFFRSDHYNFARAGVPALFLFAGVHDDYHQPSDHAEFIDAGKAARIARLAFHLGLAIAQAPEPPRWTVLGRREVLERR